MGLWVAVTPNFVDLFGHEAWKPCTSVIQEKVQPAITDTSMWWGTVGMAA